MEVASGIAGLISLGEKIIVTTWTFIQKIKDAPLLIKNIQVDLKHTLLILRKIETAVKQPEAPGVFSLQNARDEFTYVIVALRQVFLGMQRLLTKYDKVDSSWIQMWKWSTAGLGEAIGLANLLAMHKSNLTLTFQLTSGELLSSSFSRTDEQLQAITNQVNFLERSFPYNGVSGRRMSAWFTSMATYADSVRSSMSSGIPWSYRNSSASSVSPATLPSAKNTTVATAIVSVKPQFQLLSLSPEPFEVTRPDSDELTPPAPPTPKASSHPIVTRDRYNILPTIPYTSKLPTAFGYPSKDGYLPGLRSYMNKLEAQMILFPDDPDVYIWFLQRSTVAEGGLHHVDKMKHEKGYQSCKTCLYVDKAMRHDIGRGYEIIVHLRAYYQPLILQHLLQDVNLMYADRRSNVLGAYLRCKVGACAYPSSNYDHFLQLLSFLSRVSFSRNEHVCMAKKDGLARQFKEIIGVDREVAVWLIEEFDTIFPLSRRHLETE